MSRPLPRHPQARAGPVYQHRRDDEPGTAGADQGGHRAAAAGRIIIATDNDGGGDQLAGQIRAIAGTLQRPDLAVTEDRPPVRGQDWNDLLKALMAPQAHPAALELGR